MEKNYVQYGCGLSAPDQWKNYDVSPTLRIQKIPVIGSLLRKQINVVFPANVLYGNIVKGLPVVDNSCDGLYCSHTLEHLSLNDFRLSLKNSYKILKKGGIFRCVLPDIEFLARSYITELDNGNRSASIRFMEYSLLGIKERPEGFKGLVSSFFGNSHHLWMWDSKSLSIELAGVGFVAIRDCKFNDSEDDMFKFVESEDRFLNAVAIECRK